MSTGDRCRCRCGAALGPHDHAHCSWACRVADVREAGGRERLPNGLPVAGIRFDGLMLECDGGDHRDYLFPVEAINAEAAGTPYERETHALIYTDGCVAVTLHECCYYAWLPRDGGRCFGSPFRPPAAYRLAPESCAAVAALEAGRPPHTVDLPGEAGDAPGGGDAPPADPRRELEATKAALDASQREVARLRRLMETAPPWGLSEEPTAEEFHALRMRWAFGPERYQADADALIAALLAGREREAALRAQAESARAVGAAEAAARCADFCAARAEELDAASPEDYEPGEDFEGDARYGRFVEAQELSATLRGLGRSASDAPARAVHKAKAAAGGAGGDDA